MVREVALPLLVVISVTVEDSTQPVSDADLYIINLKKKLQENHEIARNSLKVFIIPDASLQP